MPREIAYNWLDRVHGLSAEEAVFVARLRANDDAELDLTDAIHVLRFLFLSGPPPLPPGPESCGPDPTGSPGALSCDAQANCP